MVQVSTYPCFFYIHSSFVASPFVSVQESNRVDPIESGYNGSERRRRHHQREEEIHCSALVFHSNNLPTISVSWGRVVRYHSFLCGTIVRFAEPQKKNYPHTLHLLCTYGNASSRPWRVTLRSHAQRPPCTASCMAIYSPYNNNNNIIHIWNCNLTMANTIKIHMYIMYIPAQMKG